MYAGRGIFMQVEEYACRLRSMHAGRAVDMTETERYMGLEVRQMADRLSDRQTTRKHAMFAVALHT